MLSSAVIERTARVDESESHDYVFLLTYIQELTATSSQFVDF